MPAYLDTIVAAHRAKAAGDPRDVDREVEDALRHTADAPPVRPFVAAIAAAARHQGMAVISEIKRRSPSKGDLDPSLDPSLVAAEYEDGGAACLSVLTDQDFFGGSEADLRAARLGCSLPVLRKDFTVSPLDLCDARRMGADAVLLIVAALDDAELQSFLRLAADLSLAALVEVHDEAELRRALDAGAGLVGVNQRDLRTFEVDHQRALTLGGLLPHGVVGIAESGISTAEDVKELAGAGYRGVLVGETLVRSADRRRAVSTLLGVER